MTVSKNYLYAYTLMLLCLNEETVSHNQFFCQKLLSLSQMLYQTVNKWMNQGRFPVLFWFNWKFHFEQNYIASGVDVPGFQWIGCLK